MSYGVLPSGIFVDAESVTANRANFLSLKKLASAESCPSVGARRSAAWSAVSAPPKCSAFISRHGVLISALAAELMTAQPPLPKIGQRLCAHVASPAATT